MSELLIETKVVRLPGVSMGALNLPFSPALRDFFLKNAYFVSERMLPLESCGRWQRMATALSRRHAEAIERDSPGREQLRYKVVTGDIIRKEWSELFALYTDERLRAWIAAITDSAMISLSSHLQSAININVLARPGDVYRWHFDAVSYTLLLYLSDSYPDDGGALEFYPNAETENLDQLRAESKVRYFPRMGDAVLMDGTRCLHRVAPIHRAHLRISIPMVYPCRAEHTRPSGLDHYLYGRAS